MRFKNNLIEGIKYVLPYQASDVETKFASRQLISPIGVVQPVMKTDN